MHATLSLPVLLAAVALSVATPYYLPQPQQRQLFYSVVPQYSQFSQYSQYLPYSAPVAPVPYRHVYYAPQTAANLVAPVPQAVRYTAPLAAQAPSKQVVYYPSVNPYPGNLVYAGDGASEEGSPSWTSWFASFPATISSFINPSSPAESPAAAEGGSPAEGAGAAAAGGEKVEQASNSEEPTPTKEEDKEKEEEAEKPAEEAKVKGVPQKYVVVGQPQFFGNFGLQRLNPAAVIPSPQHGAVSSYLLLKNYPGVKFAPQFPQIPQYPQVQQVPQHDAAAELIPAGEPGSAALGYQKLLQAAQAGRQQKEYEDDSSVTVEAAQKDAASDDDSQTAVEAEEDKPEDEESGTNE